VESVDEFQRRARTWIEENVPRAGDDGGVMSETRVRRAQALQQAIYDAGFGAITWPKQYGGQELSVGHMHAFAEELRGFQNPYHTLSVSLGVIGPTILERGTEQQKAAHLPPLLRGDTLWVQFLSEPSGGSDMAGILTTATPDGDVWVLNGAKVWTTFGHYATNALCLARTDWDVPKHRGLSMFIIDIPAPGLTVLPLKQVSGAAEFCQEFLDNVTLPADHLLGEPNEGWSIAQELLQHERRALGGGSDYFTAGGTASGTAGESVGAQAAELARRSGRAGDLTARQQVAEMHVLDTIGAQLAERVATGMRAGRMPGTAGSLLKLFTATTHLRRSEVTLELAGPSTVAWSPGDDQARAYAMGWLGRQGTAIMGGSNEIQRNIISERVLGLPREAAPDRDVPFREVRHNRART